jgi:wyosine [tRNA(Phe)-imidazoG37] synthetase (radical SAM superfamily)
MDTAATLAPHYQGYVDERSTQHIAGWLRDLSDASRRLAYEVVLPSAAGERVLASGIANAHSDVLVAVGVGDGGYAFTAVFDVTMAERDRLFVRPAGAPDHRLELAPALRTDPPGVEYQGFVDERSRDHVAGWVRNLAAPGQRIEIEVVLPTADGERILGALLADQFSPVLQAAGIGDAHHFFHLIFPARLTEAERDAVFVRPAGSTYRLTLAPAVNTRFEPINHIAMDIVNNCNLRCPFCTYDYSHTNRTEFMTEETFDSVLRLIPYVTDGNFWLSCLHEATLHPKMLDFIARVPPEYRRKLFFTTNIAKRLPLSFFEELAACGMNHLNVSLESLDPAIYERMRKGARFPIFMENWDKLLDAFRRANNPPRLRYNIMAYRSNLKEIPQLAEFLLREKRGAQIEIRNTFDGPQIQQWFRDEEFLSTEEWAWLADACAHFSPSDVLLLLPPGGVGYSGEEFVPPPPPSGPPGYVEITPGPIPRPIHINMSWKGMLLAYSEKPRQPGEPPKHYNYLYQDVKTLEDPLRTMLSL